MSGMKKFGARPYSFMKPAKRRRWIMDEFEAFFAKVFAYGVYAIWGGAVIFGFYYFFAIMFGIISEVGPLMGLFIFLFGIFFIAPSILTLIAMCKK